MRCVLCRATATDQLVCSGCGGRVALCEVHDIDVPCDCGTGGLWRRGPWDSGASSTVWKQPPPPRRRLVDYSDLDTVVAEVRTERAVHTSSSTSTGVSAMEGCTSTTTTRTATATAPVIAPATVASVEFMHGAAAATADVTQYVNITPDDAFVGGPVANRDRLGPAPRVVVRFTQARIGTCKLFLNRAVTTDLYSDTEVTKSGYASVPGSSGVDVTTDGSGTAVVSGVVSLTVCGGHRFSLRATDSGGTSVESAYALAVRRRVWIQPVYMRTARAQYLEWVNERDALIARFASEGIDFVFLDAVEIADQPNVWPDDARTTLRGNVRTACGDATAPLRPNVITVVFALQFAEALECTQLRQTFDAGETEKMFVLCHKDHPYDPLIAWSQDDLGGPAAWLTSGISFAPADGTARFALDPAGATPLSVSALHTRRRNRLSLRLAARDSANTSKLAGGGNVWFNFRYAKFLGGIAEGGGLAGSDLIAVCSQQTWQETTRFAMAQFVTHEIGHKLGLVPTGTGAGLCDLDAHATTYVDKGHTGPHCYAGVGDRESYAGVAGGTCVMYGSPGLTLDFCANCRKALRKVNLSRGWTASWA